MESEKSNGHRQPGSATLPPEVARARADAPAPRQHQPAGAGHWWVWLIVLVVVAGGGYLVYTRVVSALAKGNGPPAMAAHAVPVVVSKALRADMNIYLTGLGRAQALNTVTLLTRVDGQLEKVEYVEGQAVKKGQELALIDTRPYQAALDQAKGTLTRDQAYLANARKNVDRDAAAGNAVSAQQYDTDKATVDQYVGIVETDQAAVESAQVNLDYCHITSPLDGRIGLRLVDPGNIVNTTDTTGLAVITEVNPIAVVFSLPEDDLPAVLKRIRQGGDVLVEAYDSDMTTKIASGKLLALDSQIDSTTGTIKAKAEFANDNDSLYPSQFVNARLLVDTLPDVVQVPTAAVQRSNKGVFVYIVKKDDSPAPEGGGGAHVSGGGAGGSGGAPGIGAGSINAGAAAGTGGATITGGAAMNGGFGAGSGYGSASPAGAGPTTGPSAGAAPMPRGIVDMADVVTGPTQGDYTVITSGITPGDIVVIDGVDKLIKGSKVTYKFAPPPAPATALGVNGAPNYGADANSAASTQPTHHHHHHNGGESGEGGSGNGGGESGWNGDGGGDSSAGDSGGWHGNGASNSSTNADSHHSPATQPSAPAEGQ